MMSPIPARRTGLNQRRLSSIILSAVSTTIASCGGDTAAGDSTPRSNGPLAENSSSVDLGGAGQGADVGTAVPPSPDVVMGAGGNAEVVTEPSPAVSPTVDCVTGASGNASVVAGLNPVAPTSYVAAYQVITGTHTLVAEAGTACENATDPVACETSMQAPPAPAAAAVQYLVITDAAGVRTLDDVASVVEFLGTIDTPNEAALLLQLTYLPVGCDEIMAGDSGYVARHVELCEFSPDVETRYAVSADGTTSMENRAGGCAVPGRLADHLGIPCPQPYEAQSPAEFLKGMCELETAAVAAFLRLAADLASHGAPGELVSGARQAAAEEVRHARVAYDLACRRGQVPAPVVASKHARRSLYEIALENAVEGCVFELYAAALAHHQAMCAQDSEVKQAMRSIAEEEVGHAAWSLELHAWLMSRLTVQEQEAVLARRRLAVQQLEKDVQLSPNPQLIAALGLPRREAAERLLVELRPLFAA